MREELLLAVVAAHRTGQPLHPELAALGARSAGVRATAPWYRMIALPGPGVRRGGIVRVTEGGAAVEVELHCLPLAAVGQLIAGLPSPLALGQVELVHGDWVTGLLCESWAAATALDVTDHGSWPAYLSTCG